MATSLDMMFPANSRSELLMEPCGMSDVTRLDVTVDGKLYHQMMGAGIEGEAEGASVGEEHGSAVSLGIITPPAPNPDAS